MLNLDNLHPDLKLRLKRALYNKDKSKSRHLMNITKQIQINDRRNKSNTDKGSVSKLRDEALNEVQTSDNANTEVITSVTEEVINDINTNTISADTSSVPSVSEVKPAVKRAKKVNKLTKLIRDKD